MTTEDKKLELTKISAEVVAFKGLEIARLATRAVPGEGNPDAKLFFCGEAPGYNEDLQGRPFVGRAGKLLEKILKDTLGMDRSEVYVTNIIKYRPPDNRDPLDTEIEACRNWLDRQIQIIKPNIIVTLGRFSMAKFIPGVTITQVHGLSRFVDFQDTRYTIFPMYHPAAALRAGEILRRFQEDFTKLKDLLTPQVVPVPKEYEIPTVQQATLF